MPHQKTVALPILPGATLGVMGGGQLGRMFIHAAQSMGYTTAVLDPDANSPAGLVSHHHVQTDYLDADGLKELAQLCQAVTTEFENVPAQSLLTLAKSCPVAPSAAAVAVAQDRRVEKARLAEIGKASGVVPVPYALIEKDMHVSLVDTIYLPGILKSATQGYDGKGQIKVTTKAQLAIAWAQLGKVPCVLELMVPLHEEFSVVLARGEDGNIVHFAPQRNVHINGILAATYAHESDLKPSDVKELVDAAKAIANSLKYVFMTTSANFGNMFSMALLSLFLPFLPLLPTQVLLTNLLTDLPEMTIAGDRVDQELVARPRRWSIGFIRNFMVVFGLLSSIFDFLTFGALLFLLHANVDQFRTGWFIESVISASIIVLIIRTRRPFFSSIPSRSLMVVTLLVGLFTVILPFTPFSDPFGFTRISGYFLLAVAVIVGLYIASAELVKKIFNRMNMS